MDRDEKLAALHHIEAGVNHLIAKSETGNLREVKYFLNLALGEISKNKAELTTSDNDLLIDAEIADKIS